MEKTINISGKEVKLKCTLGTLNRYRMQFNRDPLKDIMSLSKKNEEKASTGADFDIESLYMFMNFAWCMAKTGDKNIPDVEDWLDQFEIFDIGVILPEMIELLTSNLQQNVDSKKKLTAEEQAM